ncbi:Ribonuclease inhibitor [Chelonia mydas]|uniref:Ribonuclease inhibitor n=1 Tax=Chelonia mydas TaxID=8469 RepID=M7C2N1_CHEMY|nr:Ribonuclease inhibitor [Chelonia mydas]
MELTLNNNELGDSGVELMCKGLMAPSCNLQKLWLQNCNLTDACCKYLSSVLSTKPTLIELHLGDNKLGTSGVKVLCEGLMDPNCKLQKLQLEYCELSPDHCEMLCSALRTKSSLKGLNISNNKLGDAAIKVLCQGMMDPNCKLQSLHLENCHITAASCGDLSTVLAMKPSLTELSVGENKIGDPGVALLCQGLLNPNCKIEKLWLWECGVSPAGCKDLSHVLSAKESLTELSLIGNELGDPGMELLCQGLTDPKTKLQALWRGLQLLGTCTLGEQQLKQCSLCTSHLEAEPFSTCFFSAVTAVSSPLLPRKPNGRCMVCEQPSLWEHIQKLQEELNKLGTCLFPSCTCSKNLESVGSNPEFLESSRGRLRFSLFYHREQLELLLTVIAVTGLPSRGSADSAVRVRLLRQVPSHISGLQCMVHEWQTQVVKNCRKPAFGDQFVCSLQEAELEKSTVKLEVKHFNKYSRHTVLGEVRLTLSKLKASQPMEFCEVLQKTTKDLVGEVLVSLKCLPISQKIEIGLLKVKTASVCSSPEKYVYARIDISCNLHKQKHQKSSPRARTSVIIFNETFLFHLAEPVAGAYTVLVSIYEMSSRARGRSRQLIGQAVLGKRSPSEANDHWALMMQSVQQPVAKWHPLLL